MSITMNQHQGNMPLTSIMGTVRLLPLYKNSPAPSHSGLDVVQNQYQVCS